MIALPHILLYSKCTYSAYKRTSIEQNVNNNLNRQNISAHIQGTETFHSHTIWVGKKRFQLPSPIFADTFYGFEIAKNAMFAF